MQVEAIAFTRAGCGLACRLAQALTSAGDTVRVSAPKRLADALGLLAYESLADWTARAFSSADALLFVSACGIAVRSIAPHVKDKTCDPAVVCVDETGRFAVSVLSGHVGGANELAHRVADACGGQAVVSTATDAHGVFAVDLWAKEQGLAVLDRTLVKEVSATLLEGRSVGFASEFPVAGPLPEGLVNDTSLELGIFVALSDKVRPFARTLRLVPRVISVGMGCKRGTSAETLSRVVDACLHDANLLGEAVSTLASIDIKRDEPGLAALARERGWSLRFHSAEELSHVPGAFASSAFVKRTVGVDNVCERAACACGETLLLPRRAASGVTVALAAPAVTLAFGDSADASSCAHESGPAQLVCVGLGPGARGDLTHRARRALDAAEVIVGYATYLELVRDDYPHKEFVATPMRSEVARCRLALERAAAGQRVAVVCSGDPGVYGMAGLLLELAQDFPGVEVEIIAGVTAANGGAALLGAPLMHDWCTISLSDLMTPWDAIARRLEAAARADFCIALYNPASHGRPDHLRRACDILLAYRSEETVCGLVRKVGRAGEESRTLTLGELRDERVDMLTCVFVGNSQTRLIGGRMVTPRGYQRKEA